MSKISNMIEASWRLQYGTVIAFHVCHCKNLEFPRQAARQEGELFWGQEIIAYRSVGIFKAGKIFGQILVIKPA